MHAYAELNWMLFDEFSTNSACVALLKKTGYNIYLYNDNAFSLTIQLLTLELHAFMQVPKTIFRSPRYKRPHFDSPYRS